MLTVYDFNRVTFAHHRGIVPPMPAQEGEKAVEKRYVCSANMKLMEYGYIMARDLFDACCKAEYNDFLKPGLRCMTASRRMARQFLRLLPSGRIFRTMQWKPTLWTCMLSISSII